MNDADHLKHFISFINKRDFMIRRQKMHSIYAILRMIIVIFFWMNATKQLECILVNISPMQI